MQSLISPRGRSALDSLSSMLYASAAEGTVTGSDESDRELIHEARKSAKGIEDLCCL